MFDLDRTIADWRARFEGEESFKGDDLAEMEGHIRQEFADLACGDLTERERFLIAVRRLGNPEDLSAEFAKVNRADVWRQRFFWIAVGLSVWRAAQEFATLSSIGFAFATNLARWHSETRYFISTINFAVYSAVFMAFLCLVYRYLSRVDPEGIVQRFDSKRVKAISLGAFLALVIGVRLFILLKQLDSMKGIMESVGVTRMHEMRMEIIYSSSMQALPPMATAVALALLTILWAPRSITRRRAAIASDEE